MSKLKVKKPTMSQPPLFDEGFPNFYRERYGNVNIFWFQSEFTQSKYPPGQKISEACTLICLLVAQRVSNLNLQISDVEWCPEFTEVIAEAIIEGNCIHSHIVKKKLVPHPYLDAEEALKFGGKKLSTLIEWKFQIFHEKLDTSLFRNIKVFLNDWYSKPEAPNLFMLLITCGRSILIIFQQKIRKVTLFDSHGHNNNSHNNRGLVVAQSPLASLEDLCKWYIRDVIHNCYETESDQYELACFYSRRPARLSSTTCQDCRCGSCGR